MDTKKVQEDLRNNIITTFGIDKMPEEKREEMVNRIGKIIFEAVLMRVLPMLTEEELNEYEKLLEKNVSPDQLMEFFFAKVPNFLEIISEESANFQKDASAFLAQAK